MGTAARRICVTGASGQAGRAVVRELLEHGYQVAATDIAPTRADLEADMLRADLADYGQALEALRGTEAVIHLANIPAPGICTPGGHLHRQHDDELQRFPRCHGPRTGAGGVGIQRDHARPVLRHEPAAVAIPGGRRAAAAVCPGR
ncbi:MAG: NAD-dependent epimerase/dehydratase family protein [Nocardiopsaceae bacterium]|nr:NAD-dependent epimerase/dehydratase family protein [Nocardiopsaceae bacterium]